MPSPRALLPAAAIVCAALPSRVSALQNGLGLTPPMGYSSWNDCASEITEARVKNITTSMISSGLATKGYVHINVDEGWLKGRSANGSIYEDRVKFPSGMKALGEWIHNQIVPGKGKIMKYGLYTCRGTCQCSTQLYHGPGSHGHVAEDARWLAAAGADYLKEDSCCGSQDHDTAFADYAEMRDALNSTGREVYFSLCGWNTWYAPMGDKLGNSWRIAGDGTNWGALSNCMNQNSQLQRYARPGAWNDPDLLQGTGKGSNDKATNPSGCFDPSTMKQTKGWYQTESQARAQFSMWAIMSAPLLIAADPGQVEPSMIETWGNEEIINVSQSFREGGPYQGARIFGGDLSYRKGGEGSGTNVWGKLLPGGDFALGFVSNENTPTSVTCDADCFSKLFAGGVWPPSHANATCDTAAFPRDLGDEQCLGLTKAPGWAQDDAGKCCAACAEAGASCQTWQYCAKGKPCDSSPDSAQGCYLGQADHCRNVTTGWISRARGEAPPPSPPPPAPHHAGPPSLNVRDLWLHKDLPPLKPPYTLTAKELPAHGGVAVYRLSPGP